MKCLILMRHAEAVTLDKRTIATDFDRKLTIKGIEEAVAAKGFIDSLFLNQSSVERLVSGAMRTIQTAEILFDATYDFKILDELYTINAEDLYDIITNQPEEIDTLMIIGHNPTISEAMLYFTKESILDFSFLLSGLPTAGIVVINFDTDNWSSIQDCANEIVKIFIPSFV